MTTPIVYVGQRTVDVSDAVPEAGEWTSGEVKDVGNQYVSTLLNGSDEFRLYVPISDEPADEWPSDEPALLSETES